MQDGCSTEALQRGHVATELSAGHLPHSDITAATPTVPSAKPTIALRSTSSSPATGTTGRLSPHWHTCGDSCAELSIQ